MCCDCASHAAAVICARRYVLGLPAIFGLFLWRHRVEVRSDQLLRERGEGDSALTNAHIQVGAVALQARCLSSTSTH